VVRKVLLENSAHIRGGKVDPGENVKYIITYKVSNPKINLISHRNWFIDPHQIRRKKSPTYFIWCYKWQFKYNIHFKNLPILELSFL